MKTVITTLALVLTALFGLTACSSAAPAELPAGTVVVDVRTPDEYASGHLDGAINVDVQSADFDSQISALPKDGAYVVYCRSGSRSSAAAARMADLGFGQVTDAGALSAAAGSTGLAIVTTP